MQSSIATTRRTITEILEALANTNARRIIPWPDLSESLQSHFGYSPITAATTIRDLIDRKQLFELPAYHYGIVAFTTDAKQVNQSTIRATPEDNKRIDNESARYVKSLCKPKQQTEETTVKMISKR
jgi:hypothetical protein